MRNVKRLDGNFFICKYIFDYFMSFVAHVMNQKSAFVVSF